MKTLVIEKEKLKHNIDILKSMTSSTIIAVLKGNGYGLGIVEFARFLLDNGIDYFAVSEISEAIKLREEGFENNILLLTPASSDEEAETIVQYNIIPSIGSLNSATLINEAGKRLDRIIDVHLKIDTGFGRFGFIWNSIGDCHSFLKSLENIRIVGTYSHLSFSFSKKAKLIQVQYERFLKCVEGLNQNGIRTGMLHIANSCAFLQYESMHLDAVRIGSAFLGRIPIENKYGLNRIGYMKSKIIELKELPKGYYIGYANTYKTKRPTRIGIVPVGYKDGFGVEKTKDTFRFLDILRYIYHDLKLFNKRIYVRVKGKKAKVLGRISMYNIVIDTTDLDVSIGDEVLLDVNPVLIETSIKREYL
ncbi:alanine racemase [Clostridium thermosuccinogenes]|uniref:Alanine racemase n=1 Tax=Clostridium thermosuccinogenes TaxID=84032 RepID=A0A2K2FNH6_9CLOT|nr:alanine racemase [Pseudoclostridium thermosuccinogenes]AUS97468.1 alanine racemase [Pseudoclostridium thermosuccinogenes]PNT98181.1 alanine racemase [Pseudoclostridium thermosuccinogenes]PNU00330.1 alanine racemase [Pseudoclostridium thermosuccinogenes]